jgi:hypothetical protein
MMEDGRLKMETEGAREQEPLEIVRNPLTAVSNINPGQNEVKTGRHTKNPAPFGAGFFSCRILI